MSIETSLQQLASRNIRYLQEAQSFEEYGRIMLHTDYLRKLAVKIKRRDIERMISKVVWETIQRIFKDRTNKLKQILH